MILKFGNQKLPCFILLAEKGMNLVLVQDLFFFQFLSICSAYSVIQISVYFLLQFLKISDHIISESEIFPQ